MLERAGRLVVTLLAAASARFRSFGFKALRELFAPPFEFRETVRQLFELGFRSAPLIAVSGMAVGVVLSMHTRASLERFGAESMIPAGLAIALVRETGPLTCGLLLSGRIGAGIGAELGAMRVTEQIDALEASAVDAFRYLVVTRVVACIIALPILTTIMNFAGMIGGFLAETAATGMSLPLYFNRAFSIVDLTDYVPATIKTMVFGFIIATISSLSRVHDRVGAPRASAAPRRARSCFSSIVHHRRQRGPGAADLLHLPEGGWRMTTEMAPAADAQAVRRRAGGAPRSRHQVVRHAQGARRRVARGAAGRGFCMLGRSGTGKSVTLRHIIGLVQPGRRARVRRTARRSARSAGRSLAEVRQSIGFLFQNAALFDSISVGENVAFPMRRHTGLAGRGDPRARAAEARRRRAWSGSTTRCRRRCPAACASAPGWRGRWRSTRRCCWSTSRAPASIRSRRTRSTRCCSSLKQQGGTTLVVVTHNIPSARRLGDELVMLHEGQDPGARHRRGARPQRQRDGPRVHAVAALGLICQTSGSPRSARSSSAACFCSASACS